MPTIFSLEVVTKHPKFLCIAYTTAFTSIGGVVASVILILGHQRLRETGVKGAVSLSSMDQALLGYKLRLPHVGVILRS
jgi:hypothetical protein